MSAITPERVAAAREEIARLRALSAEPFDEDLTVLDFHIAEDGKCAHCFVPWPCDEVQSVIDTYSSPTGGDQGE